MTTLADLHAEIDFLQQYGMTSEYAAKQMHALPPMIVIPADQRIPYIVARCKDHCVVNIGSASGQLHEAIKASAISVVGVDHESGPNTDVWLDLDDYAAVQAWKIPPVDLIVFAECIEHTILPGAILRKLREAHAPLLVTTPNAYAMAGQSWIKRGWENINKEHCQIYSYHSLKITLERTGWTPEAWAYYGGGPVGLNEGLVVVAR